MNRQGVFVVILILSFCVSPSDSFSASYFDIFSASIFTSILNKRCTDEDLAFNIKKQFYSNGLIFFYPSADISNNTKLFKIMK